ncbi:hypothetical protein BLOT_016089 [Blomia tropicalis]|nr:hypothetical protein BLOT_016089 [Blomia tropicalis]
MCAFKFELLEDDTPESNQTKLPAYASWTSPSSSSLPKPIGLTGTKQGKRFFRKKVTTTYEYSNKRKPIPSALADPNKSYFKFKFSPKDEPTSVSRQQQPRSRLQFLKDLVINKKSDSPPTTTIFDKTRFSSLRRRSDPSSSLSSPIVNDQNAWWSKYLINNENSPTIGQSVGTLSNQGQAAFYHAPDYVHNPATHSYLAPLDNSNPEQPNSPPEPNVVNQWVQRFYANAMPYIDMAVAQAQYADYVNKEKEENSRKSIAGRIRALYGRNKLFRQVSPGKKILTKLNSPYSYQYDYQTMLDANSNPFMETSKPDTNQIVLNNSLDQSGSHLSYNYYRPNYQRHVPQSAIYRPQQVYTFQSPPLVTSDSSRVIVPSYATYSDRKAKIEGPWDESKVSMIRFSAKDGKPSSGDGNDFEFTRKSIMESTRKMIQYDTPEPSSMMGQYRSPRRIKMGSFINSRSFGGSSLTASASDRSTVQNYDMSDIFCKTPFKPMETDSTMMASAISRLTEDGDGRDGRALKRSFDPSDDTKIVTKFVNSDWTSTIPKQITKRSNGTTSTVIRRLSKRQVSSKDELSVLKQLPTGTVVKEIDPKTTELLLRLLRNNSNATNDFQKKKITNIYYVYLPNRNRTSTVQTLNRVHTQQPAIFNSEAEQNVALRRQPPKRRPPQNGGDDLPVPEQRRPIASQTPVPTRREPGSDVPFQRRPPQRLPDDGEEVFIRQPKPQRQRPQQTQTNREQTFRTRVSTTTTTTTTPMPPSTETSGFMLTEADYEFGERLCEGRFSGSVPDPRHGCRLYFTCNADTIDTYSCPDHYRFDTLSQLCQPGEYIQCPRLF